MYTECLKMASRGSILGELFRKAGPSVRDYLAQKTIPTYRSYQQAASHGRLLEHGLNHLSTTLLGPHAGPKSHILGKAITDKLLSTDLGAKAYNYAAKTPLVQKATRFIGNPKNLRVPLALTAGHKASSLAIRGTKKLWRAGGKTLSGASRLTGRALSAPIRFAFNSGKRVAKSVAENTTHRQHAGAIEFALSKALSAPELRPSLLDRINMAARSQ